MVVERRIPLCGIRRFFFLVERHSPALCRLTTRRRPTRSDQCIGHFGELLGDGFAVAGVGEGVGGGDGVDVGGEGVGQFQGLADGDAGVDAEQRGAVGLAEGDATGDCG